MHRRNMTTAVCAAALLLAGCGGEDPKLATAADKALAKSLPGTTLGDCLNVAGYDVRPKYVRDATIEAPDDNWYRVTFQNESDSGQFIHVGVNTDVDAVLPYKDDDRAVLDAAGCSLGKRVFM